MILLPPACRSLTAKVLNIRNEVITFTVVFSLTITLNKKTPDIVFKVFGKTQQRIKLALPTLQANNRSTKLRSCLCS